MASCTLCRNFCSSMSSHVSHKLVRINHRLSFCDYLTGASTCFIFLFGGHGSDIIKGKKAPENSLLYMASVQSSTGHVCGGFLITADFVLTAAHCAKE